MKNQTQTIRKIVSFPNNPDEDGGFWLPNIQRTFVWREEQICRLFDSILREYPISTLLVWKTTSTIRHRKFIDNWKISLRPTDFYVPENRARKNLVLDGQQRLQSLFIGLRGSYEGRELCLDVLSGEIAAPDDVKYRFKFLAAAAIQFPWVRFKELVFTSENRRQVKAKLTKAANRELTSDESDKLEDHLDAVDRTFRIESTITYQVLDSIDNPELYGEDDVVEVFIRANSGGTRLSKSDLLFSLLTASWEFADEKMGDLLDSLNARGFSFDRDFVLKTCLVLLGQGARYEVAKFRKPGIRDEIESKWDEIKEAIQDVHDYVSGQTFIRCDRALPTYLVLIPLVYLRYHHRRAWNGAIGRDGYLLRSSLVGAFGGIPDTLLDGLVRKIDELGAFDLDEMFDVIRSQGRSLELTEDRLWSLGYGSKGIHLLFNLWYRDFNYTPAFENSLPQVDHIFPQSLLKEIKVVNPDTGRKIMKYRDPDRNQLANCMLLTREENGSGGKGKETPAEWFSDKSRGYLGMHLIPTDPTLWEMDRFEDFIEERSSLIRKRFEGLLSTPTPSVLDLD